jgi:hypothetical protein
MEAPATGINVRPNSGLASTFSCALNQVENTGADESRE